MNFQTLNGLYTEQFTSPQYRASQALSAIEEQINIYQEALEHVADSAAQQISQLPATMSQHAITYAQESYITGETEYCVVGLNDLCQKASAVGNVTYDVNILVTHYQPNSEIPVSQNYDTIEQVCEGLQSSIDMMKVSYAAIATSIVSDSNVADFANVFDSNIRSIGAQLTPAAQALRDGVIDQYARYTHQRDGSFYASVLNFLGFNKAVQAEEAGATPSFYELAVNTPVAAYTGISPLVFTANKIAVTISNLLPDDFVDKIASTALKAFILCTTWRIRVAVALFNMFGKAVKAGWNWLQKTFDTDNVQFFTDIADDPSFNIGGNLFSFIHEDGFYNQISRYPGGAELLQASRLHDGNVCCYVTIGCTMYFWCEFDWDLDVHYRYHIMIRKHLLNPRVVDKFFATFGQSDAISYDELPGLWEEWYNCGPRISDYVVNNDIITHAEGVSHGYAARNFCAKAMNRTEALIPYSLSATISEREFLGALSETTPVSFRTHEWADGFDYPTNEWTSEEMIDSVTRPLSQSQADLVFRALAKVHLSTSLETHAWMASFLTGALTVPSDHKEYQEFVSGLTAILAITAAVVIAVVVTPKALTAFKKMKAAKLAAYGNFFSLATSGTASQQDILKAYRKYRMLALLTGSVDDATGLVGSFAAASGIGEILGSQEETSSDNFTQLTEKVNTVRNLIEKT